MHREITDIDDFLRTSKNPEGDFEELMKSAKVIDKPRTSKKTSKTVDRTSGTKGITQGQGGKSGFDRYRFDTFEVLGELEDDRIVIESKDIRKIYIVALKDLSLEKIVQFGGPEARERVVRSIEQAQEEGKIHLYDLRKHLILEARKNQRGPLRWLGQGINLLEDDRLLIVNGDLAYIWDGSSFKPYEPAMIENKLIARNVSRKWISFKRLEKAVLEMTIEQAKEIIVKAINLVQQWGFQGAYDHALVAGFVLSQMVQSIWDWRPHLWLTGPQSSGKTLFVNLCEEIGGKLSKRFEGSSTSEAGFRQSMKHDFALPFIDEFEKSPARDQIMAYLRTAGRGGPIVKGSPGQEAIEYMLKHQVLVASIETGLVRAAEKSRFITVELKKDSNRDPHIPTVQEMERLRIQFFALALWASLPAKALVNQLGRIKRFDPRLAEAFAVPLSMISIADPKPFESLENYVTGALEDRKEHGEDTPEDEIRLLNDILSSIRRVAVSEDGGSHMVYSDRSIIWLLRSTSELHAADALTCGIKKYPDGVFFACSTITRQLLANTLWREMNIGSILKRLPGAESKQRRINGSPFRGVLVPDTSGLFDINAEIQTKENDLFVEE